MQKSPNIDAEIVAGLNDIQAFINLIQTEFLFDDVSLNTIDIFTLRQASCTQDQNNFTFTLGVTIAIEQDEGQGLTTKELSGSLVIEIKTDDNGNNYKGVYGGSLSIPIKPTGALVFRLDYQTKTESGKNTKLVVGSLDANANQNLGNVNLSNLVSEICPSLTDLFPDELLNFSLGSDVIFVINSTNNGQRNQNKMLFSIGFDAEIALSDIPLAGSLLPPNSLEGEFAFEFLVSFQKFTQKEVKTINSLLEELGTKLLIKPPCSSINNLERGASIGAHFKIAQFVQAWLLPLVKTPPTAAGGSRSLSTTTNNVSGKVSSDEVITPTDNGAWLNTQKLFRRLYFQKVGLVYKKIAQFVQAWLLPLVKTPRTAAGGSRSLTTTTNNDSGNVSSDGVITLADNGVWLNIQKSFGPLYFDKVGLVYTKGEMRLTPKFIIEVSRFTLALNGLYISSGLTAFKPHFNLDGFGLELKTRSLEMGGAFLVAHGAEGQNNYDEYLGIVTVSFQKKVGPALALSAIGSFTDYQNSDQFALFLYLAADYPFGGPPFFFVTGISGGFGYNHDLIIPPLEDIKKFPLVTEALKGPQKIDPDQTGEIITEKLEALNKYIPPSIGSGFGALGLKFTGCKIVDGFGLITLGISQNEFEINLLGIATMMLPTKLKDNYEPIAMAELAIAGRFNPMEGVILIQGQLTENSYIFSRNCRLTGGFAYGLWFLGDFVFTQGGYHPRFQVPDYYPNVPRLGLNWQIDSHSHITAQAYFAICGHGIMAGGLMDIRYQLGSVWAHFEAGLDLLLGWAPYHYDVNVYCSVRVGVGALSVGLGMGVHIWGPDFGGKLELRVFVCKVTIKIGDQSSIYPVPIKWDEFEDTFLPEPENVCSLTSINGLVKQVLEPTRKEEQKEVWIINPTVFEMSTDSLVPTKQAFVGEQKKEINTDTNFGINSMGVDNNELDTTHKVTICKDSRERAEDKFKFEPITKLASTSTWGEPNMVNGHIKPPEVNGKQFIENVFFGFRILPAELPKAGKTHEIGVEHLQYETEKVEDAYLWESCTPFVPNPNLDEENKRNKIMQTVGSNEQRNKILAALGWDVYQVDMNEDEAEAIANSFVFAPLIKLT